MPTDKGAHVEVAEAPHAAFGSRGTRQAVTARLIVRRVHDANPDHVQLNAQGGLFPAWRHHAVFTNSLLVVREENAVDSEIHRQLKHPVKRPRGKTTSAGRRADAVSDMPCGQDKWVTPVSESDSADHPVIVDDPPVDASVAPRSRRRPTCLTVESRQPS